MPNADDIFASPRALRDAFERGLSALIDSDGVGPFVLAAANASFEPELWEALRPALSARFDTLVAAYRNRLVEGRPLDDGAEDVLVFLKLALLGFDAVETTRTRRAGPWEVQFNPLRAFRPVRLSGKGFDALRKPFDPDGFHFNKPFMAKEILWEGELDGTEATLYFNKYPFASRHGLLVPERHARHPQFLTCRMFRFAWEQTARLGGNLPDVGLGYNALGAGASVNHCHLQLFVGALPVADPAFRHNGGDRPYPAHCLVFTDPDEGWRQLDRLHRRDTPYNLIFRPGRAYLLPRRPQGSFALPPWSGACAWYEMAGGAVTFRRADYESLTEHDLSEQLAAATLPL